jgi:hypothetical protein
MQRLCPEQCPHWWCYPFRHLIIVTTPSKKSEVHSFIVCANCRHGVNLPHDRCKCPANCHYEAREGRTYDPDWVAFQVTKP